MSRRILVVDEEPLKRITLQVELTEQGYEVLDAADVRGARRILDAQPVDVVVSEVRLPEMSGLDLLTHVKQQRPATEVILMSAYAAVDTAVQAIKRGAYDFLTKPFTTQELEVRLQRIFARRVPAVTSPEVVGFGELHTRSQAMRRVFDTARTVAGTLRPVLLVGESGTGKRMLAAAIHDTSPRARHPLVQCAGGLGESELLRELFGDPGGGDGPPVRGRWHAARGGTLLLADADELPLAVQRRLRAALNQTADDSDRPRLLVTAGRDLGPLVDAGEFDEGLLQRLDVITLTLPPLRDRPEDIPLLATLFVARHADLVAGRAVRIAPDALDELLRQGWPGNVRELEHVIERALAFCDGDEIRPEHVVTVAPDESPRTDLIRGDGQSLPSLPRAVADVERRLIRLALRQCHGNQARAAERLGIPRTTLRDKIGKYNLSDA